MTDFNLSIISADGTFYSGPCSHINIPTLDGFIGILANHINSVLAVTEGKIEFTVAGEKRLGVVSRGMAKIEDGDVLVLVDTCEKPEDIDRIRAQRAREEALRQIKEKKSNKEYHLAQANLMRALNRLKVTDNNSKHI